MSEGTAEGGANDTAEGTVTIQNEVGLHARPAAAFVKAAQRFESDISIVNVTRGGDPANAKSIVQIFKAAVAQGHDVRIAAEGSDAAVAVETLVALIESDFD